MPYEPYPIETDPLEIQDEAFDYIRLYWPEWEPSPGNLDTILLQSVSRMAADLRDIAANVPPYIFRRFGVEMLGIPAVEAAPAHAQVQVTIEHDDGYTVPINSLFFIRDNSGNDLGFTSVVDTVIPPGNTTGIVDVMAVIPGVAGNDVSAGAVTGLGDALAYVSAVTLVTPPANGEEAETIEEYETRLRDQLTTLSPTPIIPTDFAILSLQVPGVDRALAIDLYNPADGTYDNEKMVTVVPIDVDGEPMSGPVKAEIKDLLESMREVNFVVNVMDPTYTSIDVTYTVKALQGWSADEVEDSVNSALEYYFKPSNWGTIETSGNGLNPEIESMWRPVTSINHYEVSQVINSSPGVDLVQALSIEGSTALTINLTGAAPLTRPGVFTGTVNLP